MTSKLTGGLTISVRYASSDATTPMSCYYCGRELPPPYNYSCEDCGRQTCDYDQEMCPDEQCCHSIVCYKCMEAHVVTEHSELKEWYLRHGRG